MHLLFTVFLFSMDPGHSLKTPNLEDKIYKKYFILRQLAPVS